MGYALAALLFCIAAVFFVRDAKNYTDKKHSLSKIEIAINYALVYMDNAILKNGRMIFIKSLSPKSKPGKLLYDAAAHAKVLYTLYLCEKLVPSDVLRQKRLLSSRFFVKTYLKNIDDNSCVIVNEPKGEADYIASAFALAALANLYKTNIINIDTLRKIGDYLIDDFKPEHTGAAAFALLTLYQYDKQKQWLEKAKQCLIEDKNIEFDKLFNNAVEKLMNIPQNGLTEKEKNVLIEKIIKASLPILENQNTDIKSSEYGAFTDTDLTFETAQITDGLISVFNCIDINDAERRMPFLRAISSGADYLRRKQIQRNKPKGAVPVYAKWQTPGVPAETRTEIVQSALSVWVKHLYLFKN